MEKTYTNSLKIKEVDVGMANLEFQMIYIEGDLMKIFKKEKTNTKDDSEPNDTSKKSGGSTNFKINAEIVNGTCPYCTQETVLVCLWTGGLYRCMKCGSDVEQKVNGKISYIPPVQDKNKFQYRMKVDSDGQ